MKKGLINQFKNTPFFEVLQVNDFLKIWTSQILSQTTINLINFIIVLRIFEATHSTVAVSLVWIFYAIPALLLGPFSGTVVDMTNKRSVLMFTTLAESIIVLFYLFAKVKVWPIYSVIFMYALVNQLYIPAEASTLSTVVPKRLFAAANSLFIFTIYGSFLFGYGIAGSIVRAIGRNTPFLMAASFLVLASVSVYTLPKFKKQKLDIKNFGEFWARVTEGYQYIKAHTEILYPLILLIFANVIISVFAVLAPLFASEILRIELLDIGFYIIIPIGIGAVLGALWVVFALKRKRKKHVITTGFIMMSLVLLFFSLILPKMTFARIIVSMFMNLILGASIVSIFIPAQTMIQEKTPEEFRGRVFGVLGFMLTLLSILPILLAATIADIIGITWVIFLLAGILGFMAIYSLGEPYARKQFI